MATLAAKGKSDSYCCLFIVYPENGTVNQGVNRNVRATLRPMPHLDRDLFHLILLFDLIALPPVSLFDLLISLRDLQRWLPRVDISKRKSASLTEVKPKQVPMQCKIDHIQCKTEHTSSCLIINHSQGLSLNRLTPPSHL